MFWVRFWIFIFNLDSGVGFACIVLAVAFLELLFNVQVEEYSMLRIGHAGTLHN